MSHLVSPSGVNRTLLPVIGTVVAVCLVAGAAAQPDSRSGGPPPTASPAVRLLLDESARLSDRPADALAAADRAVTAAREAGDRAGEAGAHARRGTLLETLRRRDEALNAWKQAEAAAETLGDGPARVEALCRQAVLSAPPERARPLLDAAIRTALSEQQSVRAVAASLYRAGVTLFRASRAREANDLFLAALTLHERAVPDSLHVAASLNSLGNTAWQLGESESARTYHLRALSIQERLAPDSSQVANSLNSLSVAARALGDLPCAAAFARRSLAVLEKLVEAESPGTRQAAYSQELANSLNNLGTVLRDQGDLAGARQQYSRSLEISERLAPDSRDVATALSNLSGAVQNQGDLETAGEYLKRAIGILETVEPESPTLASVLNNFGTVQRELGNLAAARDLYTRALEIQDRWYPNSQVVAICLGNLGGIANQLGDRMGARELYRRGLEIHERLAPRGSPGAANTLNNLGSVAFAEGDLAGARDFFARALAMHSRLAPDSLPVASSLNNLGSIAQSQGDLDGAQRFHERALDLREKRAPGSLNVAWSLHNLGIVAHTRKDLNRAADFYRRALTIRQRVAPGSSEVALSLSALGNIAHEQGDLTTAEALYRRAWSLVRIQADAASGDESRQLFSGTITTYATRLIEVQVALGKPEAALTTLEEGRAQALLQVLRERNVVGGDPGKRRLWEMAARAQQQAQVILARIAQDPSRSSADLDAARSTCAALRVRTERAWAAVRASAPRIYLAPLPAHRLRTTLRRGDLFLATMVGKESVLLLTLLGPRGRIRVHRVEGAISDLKTRLTALAAEVGQPWLGTASVHRRAEALAGALLPRTVRRELAAANRVIIAPDRFLWNVPWAALPLGQSSLGLEKPVVITPSLTVFATGRREPRVPASPHSSVVAVGGCLFEPDQITTLLRKPQDAEHTASGVPGGMKVAAAFRAASARPSGDRSALRSGLGRGSLELLPATAPEAAQIAAIYGAKPVLGLAATEARVRTQLASATIIHLATHGVFHPTVAASSGVALTCDPDGSSTREDGALQAWECYGADALRLRAEVLVLSACETGKGELKPGEGAIGLTRALQVAGARSVVASRWSVADESTAALMTAFHRGLQAGLAKDEAMRRAMRTLKAVPKWEHPFYWAPFFVTGDPDPLPASIRHRR